MLRRLGMIVLANLLLHLPARARARFAKRLFNWRIDPTARIGLSLVVNVDRLTLQEGAVIGHLSVLMNLYSVTVGRFAVIGNWNWVSGARMFTRSSGDTVRSFHLQDHGAVTSRHYVDCSGGVAIGPYTTIAGVRTTILTHQIDIVTSYQTCKPVSIGAYCFIGSDCRILPGVTIAERALVAMGSVVSADLTQPATLYAGVPARMIRPIEGAAYFHRLRGFVPAASPLIPEGDTLK